jgi:carbonic anhydrase
MILSEFISYSLSTATVDANGWRNITKEGGSDEANNISFLTISNQSASKINVEE